MLATDFDGTVAPIVPNPSAAALHPEARVLLARAAKTPGVCVAFISGRDIDDLRSRTIGIDAVVAGSHGLECATQDGGRLWTPRRDFPGMDRALLDALAADGLRIERKRYSVAVHFREAAERDHTAVLARFVRWAREESLEVIPGRMVIEARVRGAGKRAALRAIAAWTHARRVVYAGDDTTDFDALGFAATRGRAVFVESPERSAPDIQPLDRAASIEMLCGLLAREVEQSARA
ncbi:MAG TPA: trehalose-phosphatase [Thermoanaerobaculia bacterium]|nr:trehalose-phosphatase [Thermoanaerobaculia bacterium]